MEVTAAFEAVKANPGLLEVVSDSTYVVNCFRDRWHEGWLRRGWLNSQKKPVANRDLWEPFVELVLERGDVIFRWVKGHSGDPMNDLVDRLAVEAATTQKHRSGTEPPIWVGPADTFGGGGKAARSIEETQAAVRASVVEASTAAGRPYAGRALLVAGHRPPVVDPEGDPGVVGDLLDVLVNVLLEQEKEHPDLVVVTGLRQGAEQLAAEAAVGADLPYVAVLPWPDPASGWPSEARDRFVELAEDADQLVLLQDEVPDSTQAQTAAMARRDGWLARNVDAAVVVWDGADDAVGRFHRSLVDHLGPDAVSVVRPG